MSHSPEPSLDRRGHPGPPAPPWPRVFRGGSGDTSPDTRRGASPAVLAGVVVGNRRRQLDDRCKFGSQALSSTFHDALNLKRSTVLTGQIHALAELVRSSCFEQGDQHLITESLDCTDHFTLIEHRLRDSLLRSPTSFVFEHVSPRLYRIFPLKPEFLIVFSVPLQHSDRHTDLGSCVGCRPTLSDPIKESRDLLRCERCLRLRTMRAALNESLTGCHTVIIPQPVAAVNAAHLDTGYSVWYNPGRSTREEAKTPNPRNIIQSEVKSEIVSLREQLGQLDLQIATAEDENDIAQAMEVATYKEFVNQGAHRESADHDRWEEASRDTIRTTNLLLNLYEKRAEVDLRITQMNDPQEIQRRVSERLAAQPRKGPLEMAKPRTAPEAVEETEEPEAPAKPKKKNARDRGVPEPYLADNGNFGTGLDARYKSDLVASALGYDNKGALMQFDPDDAIARLEERGWMGFYDRKKAILDEKAAAKAKREADKAEADAAKERAKEEKEEAEAAAAS